MDTAGSCISEAGDAEATNTAGCLNTHTLFAATQCHTVAAVAATAG